MAFYVRYFNAEALLQKESDIVPFMAEHNLLSPRELEVLKSYIGKLKGGTNRIFLDKKKYILAIGTDKTDITEFQKNARKEARPAPKPKKVITKPAGISVKEPLKGWYLFSMEYSRIVGSANTSYTFKAKIKDACLLSAYDQMADYLAKKHGDNCVIPEFSQNLLKYEQVAEK